MQLGYLRLDWQSIVIAIGTGVAAALALLLLRRILGWILGPIFVHETTRLARKGHTFWLRCLFALGMLGLLFFTAPGNSEWKFGFGTRDYDEWEYHVRDESDHPAALEHQARAMARFAEEFSILFLLVVGVAVILITPLYFATAISEEKEKRCIDFLLATHVTNYEIVIGKYAARFVNLFGILLAGLPVLALTQFWGGVDASRLIKGFITIIFAMMSYAGVSILFSALVRRTRTAVILACLFLLFANLVIAGIGYWELSSPVGFLSDGEERFQIPKLEDNADLWQRAEAWFEPLKPYCELHLGATVLSLGLAVIVVRRLALKQASRRRRVYLRDSADPRAANRPVHPLTVKNNPPIGRNPLIWKERYLGRTFGGFAVGTTMWLLVNLFIASFFPILLIIGIREWQELTHGVPMRVGLILMGLVVIFGVGMRLASCITREREQGTMLSLLTLPVTAGEILRAKWIGALHRSARPILGL